MAALETTFVVRDYDLAATLGCGQAFRWQQTGASWTGVVGGRWLELTQRGNQIIARSAVPQSDWRWLSNYLQTEIELAAILATFPNDAPMQSAVTHCRGLRLLRQEPWECLASFILSATKQIVQIREIIRLVCSRHGNEVGVPPGQPPAFAFPGPEQIAALAESQLRDCKMGFRAPNLLNAARQVVEGALDLEAISQLDLPAARERLQALRGVGPKIADCVLLFAYGFPTAFPVDVWVMKALRQYYFPRRRVSLSRLREFSATHFGPHGGYAQQYLFHSLRQTEGKKLSQ